MDRFKTLDISESEDYELSNKCPGASKQEIVCFSAFCNQKHYTDNGYFCLIYVDDLIKSITDLQTLRIIIKNNLTTKFNSTDEGHYRAEDFHVLNLEDDLLLDQNELPTKPMTVIQYYHLIIVGIICFLLGGIVIIVFLSHYKPSLLFGWERFLPSIDGVSTEKCEVVTAFSSNCIPAALAKYPHVANGVVPVIEDGVHHGSCSTTNSSQAPLVDVKLRNLKT